MGMHFSATTALHSIGPPFRVSYSRWNGIILGPVHSYYVQAAYSYIINGTQDISPQIRLWNPRLEDSPGWRRQTLRRVILPHSSVDVHYAPQRKRTTQSSFPAPTNSPTNSSSGGGCFLVVILITCQIIWYRKDYIRLSRLNAGMTRPKCAGLREPRSQVLESEMSSQSFLSYLTCLQTQTQLFPGRTRRPPDASG